MFRRSVVAALLGLSSTSFAFSADWPQLGGPVRTGVTSETGLLKSFPAEGPKVLWMLDVGEGFGGAAIVDGQAFVLDRTGEAKAEKDVLRCLDVATGKELWSFDYSAPGRTGYPGSRAVPTVTERHVFSVGPFGHFYCIDRQTQQAVWQTNIIEPGTKLPPWAISQSPLAYKQSVIVSTQGSSGGLAAFDQASGKILWQSKEVPSVAYCSPMIITIGGNEQLVLCHKGGVMAVDPETGKMLWSYDGWKCNIPIPNVTPLGDGRLFVTGGYRAGSAMIQVTSSASGFEVKELWRIAQGSQIHQPLFVDGCIYFNGTTNDARDGLVCIDPADGKVLWSTKSTFPPERGNLILADGMIYHIDGSGTLRLIQPDREKYNEVSSVKLAGGKDIWAPMAVSDGKLVIRDQKQMKGLDIKVGQP